MSATTARERTARFRDRLLSMGIRVAPGPAHEYLPEDDDPGETWETDVPLPTVECVTTGQTFLTIQAAADSVGVTRSGMVHALTQGREIGGKVFRKLDAPKPTTSGRTLKRRSSGSRRWAPTSTVG